MANPTYGAQLRAARNQLGWSQGTAAQAVGVQNATYGAWERDNKVPNSSRKALLDKEIINRAKNIAESAKPKKTKASTMTSGGKVVGVVQSGGGWTTEALMGLMHITDGEKTYKAVKLVLQAADKSGMTLQQLIALFSGA